MITSFIRYYYQVHAQSFSLASLFEYLCEKNAVTHNPVKGVERPRTESGEGKTPAIGDHQARQIARSAGRANRQEQGRSLGTRAKACRT